MKSGVVTAIGRKDGSAEHEILGRFDDGNSSGLHRVGKASLGGVDAVLNVDGGEVGVAVEVEGGDDTAGAVVAAGGLMYFIPRRR